MKMEQADRKDSSILIGPEKADIERLIIKDLRGGPKKPGELAQLYKDNGVSHSKYYRTLKRLIRTRIIDEMNVKGNRPSEYCQTSSVVDPDKLDFLIQKMVINSESDLLIPGLVKLSRLVKSGRTAWYFSEKTQIRNKDSINSFFDFLNNHSSEVREKIIDILTDILNREPEETRWRKDFKEQIMERVIERVKNEQEIKIKAKALNLIGSLSPKKGFEMAIDIICDTSLSEAQFKEINNQIKIELFDSSWTRQNNVEIMDQLLQLKKKYKLADNMKTEESTLIQKRLIQLIEEAPNL